MPVLRRESMLAVTVDNVMSWRLCDGYTRYRVKTLFAGREAREQAQADLDRWAKARGLEEVPE